MLHILPFGQFGEHFLCRFLAHGFLFGVMAPDTLFDFLDCRHEVHFNVIKIALIHRLSPKADVLCGFGCGANGDAIDLTAKLFDLNPRQAAEKLIHDFGLDPDKPPANAIALPPPKRGLTDEQWADIAYCLRVLTDYLDLLHDWRECYKPTSPEEPLDERFVEALHMTETIEHLTDCVAFGTPQQKAAAAAQLLSGSYLLMLEERTDRLALAKCA